MLSADCHFRGLAISGTKTHSLRDLVMRFLKGSAVTNAEVLCTTIYIQAALVHLRAQGETLNDEDIARFSPLCHGHINMLGHYNLHAGRTGDQRVSAAIKRGARGRFLCKREQH